MSLYSKTLRREFGFKISVDVSAIFESAPQDEKIIVQGMIDAYYTRSDGRVVIVDYKTDKINDIEEMRNRYAVQLQYYKTALEKALGVEVAGTYLMLLDMGEVLEVKF